MTESSQFLYVVEQKSDGRSQDFLTKNGSRFLGLIHNRDLQGAESDSVVSCLDGHFLEIRSRRVPGLMAIHFQRFR